MQTFEKERLHFCTRGVERMTRQEVSGRYQISLSALRDYESWGLCAEGKCPGAWLYDEGDVERLSLLLTLRDADFDMDEAEVYLRFLLERPDSGPARLRMMERKRSEMLDEMHLHERRLARLDYLRHEIQKKEAGET